MTIIEHILGILAMIVCFGGLVSVLVLYAICDQARHFDEAKRNLKGDW